MINDPAKTAGGTLGEYAYRDARNDRSIGEVLKDIFSNVQEMIRSEIRLARAEMREEAGKTASSAQTMAVGGVLALFALGFVLVAISQALAAVMPDWAASLVMGVVLGIAGVVLLTSGKKQLHAPTPSKTIENVKENVEWMKNQTK